MRFTGSVASVGTSVESTSQPNVLERLAADPYVNRNRPYPSPTVRADTDTAVCVTARTADSTVFGANCLSPTVSMPVIVLLPSLPSAPIPLLSTVLQSSAVVSA